MSDLSPDLRPLVSLVLVVSVSACGSDAGTSGAADALAQTADAHAQITDAAAGSDAAAPEGDASVTPDAGPPATACRGDLDAGEKQVFYDGFAGGSEGIAAGPDALYVSRPRTGEVWRLAPDGTAAFFASVPNALGLAFLSDGRLAVADIGASNEPGVNDGGVWLVDPDGTATQLATGIDSPNFLTVLPDDSLLVADDFDTRVWHVALDGQVSPALAEVPSPNGMAFNLARDRLLVVSTFTPDGELSAYGVDAQGRPVEAQGEVLHRSGVGMTQDGVALDSADQLYVARNLPGTIARHGPAPGVEPVIVAEGLRTPASLAFGRAPGFDPCSLYVTELYGTRVWRIAVGVPGAPLP